VSSDPKLYEENQPDTTVFGMPLKADIGAVAAKAHFVRFASVAADAATDRLVPSQPL